jgi:hypothetical protein
MWRLLRVVTRAAGQRPAKAYGAPPRALRHRLGRVIYRGRRRSATCTAADRPSFEATPTITDPTTRCRIAVAKRELREASKHQDDRDRAAPEHPGVHLPPDGARVDDGDVDGAVVGLHHRRWCALGGSR